MVKLNIIYMLLIISNFTNHLKAMDGLDFETFQKEILAEIEATDAKFRASQKLLAKKIAHNKIISEAKYKKQVPTQSPFEMYKDQPHISSTDNQTTKFDAEQTSNNHDINSSSINNEINNNIQEQRLPSFTWDKSDTFFFGTLFCFIAYFVYRHFTYEEEDDDISSD